MGCYAKRISNDASHQELRVKTGRALPVEGNMMQARVRNLSHTAGHERILILAADPKEMRRRAAECRDLARTCITEDARLILEASEFERTASALERS